MGGPRAETGADHREHEAEHRKGAEAEDQGIDQVHADGSHHLAVDEQPAVDRVTTQSLGQPDGVGERDHGGHRPDGGLQARAERPAGPPGRERRDEEDGDRCGHEHECE
ncbi:MAG TPA: hypothetical protein VND02_08185 [Actinomycetota bacterium]|nr:hypothetical protein [Actinomycetota bacterium]